MKEQYIPPILVLVSIKDLTVDERKIYESLTNKPCPALKGGKEK